VVYSTELRASQTEWRKIVGLLMKNRLEGIIFIFEVCVLLRLLGVLIIFAGAINCNSIFSESEKKSVAN
jgi:hypothetical protein